MGAQKNRLIETVLLSTHNMFCFRNKKVNFRYALLTKVLEECVTEKNLISQPKTMLCVVLKRTISMRHFFYATKPYAKNMGKKIFIILH